LYFYSREGSLVIEDSDITTRHSVYPVFLLLTSMNVRVSQEVDFSLAVILGEPCLDKRPRKLDHASAEIDAESSFLTRGRSFDSVASNPVIGDTTLVTHVNMLFRVSGKARSCHTIRNGISPMSIATVLLSDLHE
jgi:hypothetical protein